MKIFFHKHEFQHSWQNVTAANWRKYPNRNSPQVMHVDVIDRKFDPETGILHSERLIACLQPMPVWIQKLFGTDISYFYEVSQVDAAKQTYTATTTNLTYSNYITLEERLEYKPHPEDCSRTVLEQEAAFDASAGFSSAKNYIEEFCVSRFQANAERGKKGLEEVLNSLLRDDESSFIVTP